MAPLALVQDARDITRDVFVVGRIQVYTRPPPPALCYVMHSSPAHRLCSPKIRLRDNDWGGIPIESKGLPCLVIIMTLLHGLGLNIYEKTGDFLGVM